jgi:hypothetical protein
MFVSVSDLVLKGIVLASEDTYIIDQYYLLGKYIVEYRVNGIVRRVQWFTN